MLFFRAVAGGVERHVANLDHAGLRLFQQVEAAQQGRFAGAGGADDRHHFAFADSQADIVQHHLVAETFIELFYTDHKSLSVAVSD